MSSSILAVYLGNLRQDYDDNLLKKNILCLFREFLVIQLTNDDIEIKTNEEDNCVYARVKLQYVHDLKKALENLKSWENRTRLGFNFVQKLVKPYEKLLVTDTDQHNLFYTLQKVPLAGKFYHLNDMIGQETRTKEFKTGGGDYLNYKLKDDIGKYLTAFLNSNVNGTLYIGVKDDGHVEGVEIKDNQEEDNWRRRIDEAVKGIKPTLLLHMYTVDFITVLCKGNRRKVIEITVFGENVVLDELYSSKDSVFVRRDGSVQKFSPVEIQDWTKQKYKKDIVDLKKRLDKKSEKLHDSKEVIEQQKQDITKLTKKIYEQSEQIRRNPKSKTCSLM